MHEVEIPAWAVARVIKRRGAEYVFTDLDPARTALIVIDMQNAFMLPGVAFVEIKAAPGVAVDWSTYYRLSTPDNGERRSNALVKGTEGHQMWKDLDVRDGEPVIEKTKFSALVQGSSGLDQFLRERGIDTLVITGCLTDVCCESTARDAMMLNYRAIR